MQFSRACKFSPVVALFTLAGPAQALTTTYYWGLQDGSRNDRIFLGCTDDPSFPAEFPELCGDETTALLSVVFEHDQQIWDNDASGCEHPEDLDIRCRLTEFDQILGITLSGAAVFDPSEVSGFTALDFLGRCPGDCSETPGPPYITFHAVDALTGLELGVGADEFGFSMELQFPDGRTFEDDFFTEWSEGFTVPEPGAFGLFGLGLAGLGLLLRRGRMGETQRCRRGPSAGELCSL